MQGWRVGGVVGLEFYKRSWNASVHAPTRPPLSVLHARYSRARAASEQRQVWSFQGGKKAGERRKGERWRGRNDKFESVGYTGNTGKKSTGIPEQSTYAEGNWPLFADVRRLLGLKQCPGETQDLMASCE
ncbi:hypothetical protein PHYPO_G00206420 [Pangasianodon hypophthalmus]|uniref:Uncharacterized protein n=1 Tax=Pangasianodon hypophthalmus TaxID=310915 RepID=A0A5N5PBZ3_PANHP|nr:hypothetical protein PHYPO_G00206420 [Pangasianodon hypophthalmus]